MACTGDLAVEKEVFMDFILKKASQNNSQQRKVYFLSHIKRSSGEHNKNSPSPIAQQSQKMRIQGS